MQLTNVNARNEEPIDDHAYACLDNRGSQNPVPGDLIHYLSNMQLRSFETLKDFGWRLAFLRRPLFEPPTLVLVSPEGKQYATLDDDGSLNLEPPIHVRFADEDGPKMVYKVE